MGLRLGMSCAAPSDYGWNGAHTHCGEAVADRAFHTLFLSALGGRRAHGEDR